MKTVEGIPLMTRRKRFAIVLMAVSGACIVGGLAYWDFYQATDNSTSTEPVIESPAEMDERATERVTEPATRGSARDMADRPVLGHRVPSDDYSIQVNTGAEIPATLLEHRERAAATLEEFFTLITPDKRRRVLAVLYDYQEIIRPLQEERFADHDRENETYWEREYRSRDELNLWEHITFDADQALREILSPGEYRWWHENIALKTQLWNVLDWPYEPCLIVPADDLRRR